MNRRKFLQGVGLAIVGGAFIPTLLPKKKVKFQPNEIQAAFIKAMNNTYYCTVYKGRLVISGMKK